MTYQYCEYQAPGDNNDLCRRPTYVAMAWDKLTVPVCPIHARKLAERLEALSRADHAR